MTTNDQLHPLLAACGISDDELSADDVVQLCRVIGLDYEPGVAEEVLDEVGRLDPTHSDTAYEFRVGRWRVGIAGGAVRTSILTVIAAAALVHEGIVQVGVAVATAILPSVLDVERVELGAGDRRLLVELRLKDDVRERFMTEDQLYAALPDEARNDVNRYDFADFVARVRDAGLLEEESRWIRPMDPDSRRPFLSIR